MKKKPKYKRDSRTRQQKEEDMMDLCMKEMFLRVGLVYPNPEFTSQKDWYSLKTWTEQQENDFKEWMVKFIWTKMRSSYWTKKDVDLKVGMFLLNYGWRNERQAPLIRLIK